MVSRVSPQAASATMVGSKAWAASPAGRASTFWALPFSTAKRVVSEVFSAPSVSTVTDQ